MYEVTSKMKNRLRS